MPVLHLVSNRSKDKINSSFFGGGVTPNQYRVLLTDHLYPVKGKILSWWVQTLPGRPRNPRPQNMRRFIRKEIIYYGIQCYWIECFWSSVVYLMENLVLITPVLFQRFLKYLPWCVTAVLMASWWLAQQLTKTVSDFPWISYLADKSIGCKYNWSEAFFFFPLDELWPRFLLMLKGINDLHEGK